MKIDLELTLVTFQRFKRRNQSGTEKQMIKAGHLIIIIAN